MAPPSRLPRDFSRSAAYPLYAIDLSRDEAMALHFGPEDYRRASFLDDRALTHRQVDGWSIGLGELEQALADSPTPRLHWLFHIGHCGSTLCSRLLDIIPGVLGLREPLPLLALASAGRSPKTDRWRAVVAAAMARRFADTQAAVVKPTSVVAAQAADWLQATTGQACLLWIDLRSWLAAILRDDGLREAMLAAIDAAQPFAARPTGPPRGDGERLAALWLARQLRWQQLAIDPGFAQRVMDLDFDLVLADPATVIARLANHFGLAVPADLGARIKASGLLDVYAKDPRQAFDADTRRRELTAAARQHAGQIDAGVRWARLAIDAGAGGAALLARLGAHRE